jgi:histidinol-phosphatase (PHP family)
MGGDRIALATEYYESFCSYLERRRPDVIGHFDLLTKYDEKYDPIFLGYPECGKLAEEYIARAAKYGCIFEVNTGAISRGYRVTPYPANNLMHVLKKEGARIILTSDSHHKDTLDCHFTEAKKMLRDIGFSRMAVLYNGEFRDTDID